MKIKFGTMREDVTVFGNRFYIQIEDSETNDNKDLREFLDKAVVVVLDTEERMGIVSLEVKIK